MQEEMYRDWLNARYPGKKTRIDQLSRARRLDDAFGDLDLAYDADGMWAILIALKYNANDAAAKRPLPAGIVSDGKPLNTMRTLRSAAHLYIKFKKELVAAKPPVIPMEMVPLRAPKPAPKRKIQPTGYWMFACSLGVWNVDAWAETGERELLYTVADDDVSLIQAGDLGVIKRNVWRDKPSEIVAIVEVIEGPIIRPEPNHAFFADPSDAQPYLRVKLAILALPDPPVRIEMLPRTPAFKYFHRGLQRTTTAIPHAAFERIARLAGLRAEEVMAARGVRTPQGVAQVEAAAAKLNPKKKERVSEVIERGPVGAAVKVALRHRCQICEALGRDPLGFMKPNGERYSEAHHVMPVAKLIAGSLGAQNIMVLCPNHHRQVHYGRYEEVRQGPSSWTIKLDGRKLEIERTIL